eukprot:s5779_g2.t1
MRPLLDFDGGAPESRLELEAALVLGALPRWTCSTLIGVSGGDALSALGSRRHVYKSAGTDSADAVNSARRYASSLPVCWRLPACGLSELWKQVAGASYVNGGTYGPEDMFLFVNPGSGGNKGKIFLDAPKPFIVECPDRKKVNLHIFSMLEGSSGNKPGFHKLREVCSRRPGTPVRAIVGGGDGTVMWADSEATKHGIQTPTQVAWGIVPLGTGNDFSRVAGWGGNNPEGIDENNWELLKTLARGVGGRICFRY